MVIFVIEKKQNYLKYTGKHSVEVQISIDTENILKKCREENWIANNAMKMILMQYTLAVKAN